MIFNRKHAYIRALTYEQERELVEAYCNTDESVKSIQERFGLKGSSMVSVIIKRWRRPLRGRRVTGVYYG